jgi:D-sedoheptulose 7-phosphate isomerase
MDNEQFLNEYFDLYRKVLFDENIYPQLIEMKDMLVECHQKGNRTIFAGNGGCVGIASHAATDFTKQGGITSINFNEPGLITCFANDFGYEEWVAKALEYYAHSGDVVVLMSVSGKSANVVNAAKYARSAGIKVVTFTGHHGDNPLKSHGDLNFWVDSMAYNIVECTFQVWLLTVCDLIIGKAEYSVS